MITPPTEAYEFPSLAMEAGKIVAQEQFLESQGVKYLWDAKAVPLDVDESTITHLDCSGFSRLVIFHALGQPSDYSFPDGSVTQREWCTAHGFKTSEVVDGELKDGAIRIAFWPETSAHAGHVMLLPGDGYTCECDGEQGVGRRLWSPSEYPFMGECLLFVLTPPTVV